MLANSQRPHNAGGRLGIQLNTPDQLDLDAGFWRDFADAAWRRMSVTSISCTVIPIAGTALTDRTVFGWRGLASADEWFSVPLPNSCSVPSDLDNLTIAREHPRRLSRLSLIRRGDDRRSGGSLLSNRTEMIQAGKK
jgi:hypothetical protein